MPPITAAFDERVAHFIGDVMKHADFASTVSEVVNFACTTLGTIHGGVTLVHSNGAKFETVGQTSDLVSRADELQYELREGPCIYAASEERLVRSENVDTDERWPRWGPQASALGLHSVLSVDLHARNQRIGALNLYGERYRQFSHDDTQTAHMFGYHASAALAAARNEEGLRQALDTRLLIGQAEGILMERFDLEPDQAFAVLRRFSQHGNVKLNDVARQVVSTRELPHQLDPAT
jgi:GAF domain-containing protein